MGTNCCSRNPEEENEILRPEKTIISNHTRTKIQQSDNNNPSFISPFSSYGQSQKENVDTNSPSKDNNQVVSIPSQIEPPQEKLKSPIIIPEKDNTQQVLETDRFLEKTPEYSTPLKEGQDLNTDPKNTLRTNKEDIQNLQNNSPVNNSQQTEKNNNEQYTIQYTYVPVDNINQNQIIQEIPNNENILLTNDLGQNVKYTTVIENTAPEQNVIYDNSTQNIPQNEIIIQNKPILLTSENNEKNLQNIPIYQSQPETTTQIIYSNPTNEIITQQPISNNNRIIQNDSQVIIRPAIYEQVEPQYIIQNNQQQIISSNEPDVLLYNDPQIYNQQIGIENASLLNPDLQNQNNLLQTNEKIEILNSNNDPNLQNAVLIESNDQNHNQFLDFTPHQSRLFSFAQTPNQDYQKSDISTPNQIEYQQSPKNENQFIDIQKHQIEVSIIQKILKNLINYMNIRVLVEIQITTILKIQ